jgi:hypothetical protein
MLEIRKRKEIDKTADNEMIHYFKDTRYFDTLEEVQKEINKDFNSTLKNHNYKHEYSKDVFYHKFTCEREINTPLGKRKTYIITLYYEI